MHALAKKKFSGQQVMSIEDPVEIKQEEMLQLQLNEAIGMTYDSLIKTVSASSPGSPPHRRNS